MKYVVLVLSVASLLIVLSTLNSCSSAQPPKIVQVLAPEVSSTDPDMPRCKLLFEQNCQRCHKLPQPIAYSTERWNKVMPIMAGKAKIDQATSDAIMKYVMAARTVGISPTPMK